MTAAQPLRLAWDADSGEVQQPDRIAELERQLAEAERDLRRYRSRVTQLNNELDIALGVGECHDETMRLLNLWHELVMDGNKRVTVDRSSTRYRAVAKAVKRRSKRKRDEGILEKAIRGVLLDDFAMGRLHKTRGHKFCDIEHHVFKDDYSIERFAGLYERSLKEHGEKAA